MKLTATLGYSRTLSPAEVSLPELGLSAAEELLMMRLLSHRGERVGITDGHKRVPFAFHLRPALLHRCCTPPGLGRVEPCFMTVVSSFPHSVRAASIPDILWFPNGGESESARFWIYVL